jgi:hypothetical protein
MCRIELIYSAAELKKLDRKSRDALTRHGLQLVQKDRAIKNIIKKDPKICKALKKKLRPTFNRLKRKAAAKS